jgi:SAM-dependent methyltransferase
MNQLIPFIPYPDAASSIELDTKVHRWTALHETQALCHLARSMDGAILEMGCNEGRTTFDLATTNPNRFVLAVDYSGEDDTLCPEQKYEKPTRERIGQHARHLPNVRVFHAKSMHLPLDRGDVNDAITAYANNPHWKTGIRFFFVDGDHSYAGVKADTEHVLAYLRRLGGTAMIAWHDVYDSGLEWIGVHDYLRQEILPLFPELRRVNRTCLAVLVHDFGPPVQV